MVKSIRLPIVTQQNRFWMLLLGCIVFDVLYLGLGGHPLRVVHSAPVLLLDDMLPFVSSSIYIYLSQFVFLWLGFWFASNDQERSRCYYSYLFASLIATVVFIIYPTTMPSLDAGSSYSILFEMLYKIDVPYNCLPSLHTALAIIAAYHLSHHKKVGKVSFIWAALIIISTLTTKQHTILDVIAGIVLSCFTIKLCSRLRFSKHENRSEL